MHRVIPLDMLRTGETGRVQELDGDAALIHRLDEMGLRPGVEVSMVQAGSPCIVAFGNHRLSLRTDDTALITVELLDEGAD